MPASIGVNLRVTGNCRQGGRKYMEDCFSVAYQQTEDEKDLEYAFFGIYDGHGGVEAASFAKEHLMETIIKHKNFWSDNDEDVLRAIKDGYIATHYAMWREQSKWPRTNSGLPSTAGTTASVAFIRRGKIYIGHVGDSGIILGYQEPGSSEWKAKPLTKDHKPENPDEIKRIESCGGKVVAKSGVPRVVWNRPKIGHQGPVRRSTPIDEIPFLAVARSLGDLWSYNSQINQFVVSPDPDCSVLPIDTNIHRCLIFGTDGLFNMLSAGVSVHIVQQAERHNECEALSDDYNKVWLNPSKLLVERALDRWHATKMRADNTSAVTLMLDPPGPPRAQVLKDRKKNLPESGLKIMTRYDENAAQESTSSQCNSKSSPTTDLNQSPSDDTSDSSLSTAETAPQTKLAEKEPVGEKVSKTNENTASEGAASITPSISSSDISSICNYPLKERNFVPKVRESTSFDPREPYRPSDVGKENDTHKTDDSTIQINEISSSNIQDSLLEEEGHRDMDVTTQAEKESRCTLRSSTKKQVKHAEEPEKKAPKRKLEAEDDANPQQRKSMRLSMTQKFLEDIKKPAPCTLAEEKLKKLAEQAEKTKPTTNPSSLTKGERENNNNNPKDGPSRKLSLAQKILKSKKLTLKKKSLVKSQLNRKKLKMVLETVIAKTGKSKVGPMITKSPVLERSLRLQEKRGQEKLAKATEKAVKGQEKSILEKALGNKSLKPDNAQEKVAKIEKNSSAATTKKEEKEEKIKDNAETKQAKTLAKVVKNKKVLSGKLINFKRQSVRNASQRPKDLASSKKPQTTTSTNDKPQLVEKPTKKTETKPAKVAAKEPAKKEVKSEKKASETPRKGKLQVLNTIRETRSSPGNAGTLRGSTRGPSAGNNNDAKENIKGASPTSVKKSFSKQKASQKQPTAKNTLRQRIQDKTKTLKKSVLKKSR